VRSSNPWRRAVLSGAVALLAASLTAVSGTSASAAEPTPGAQPQTITNYEIPIKPGLGLIRIGFFIMQENYGHSIHGVSIGPTLAGDGRGFNPGMTAGDNRVFVLVNYEFGFAQITVNPSCVENRTSCKDAETLTSQRASISERDNGTFETSFHLSVENSEWHIPGVGGPWVTTDFDVVLNPDNTICILGAAPGFPSIEAYHDWPNGATDTVFQHEQSRVAGVMALELHYADFDMNTCAPSAPA
jgi:hypothetical protein